MSRRDFLRGLVSLPLIGGGVTLVGNPTAAAVPTTTGLLQNYEAWLAWERFDLQREIWGEDVARKSTTFLAVNLPGEQWHRPWRDEEPPCPPASTRAALVLATVGCPLDSKRSLYADLPVRGGL